MKLVFTDVHRDDLGKLRDLSRANSAILLIDDIRRRLELTFDANWLIDIEKLASQGLKTLYPDHNASYDAVLLMGIVLELVDTRDQQIQVMHYAAQQHRN